MTISESHSEMERGGYYNEHSRPQGSASELGIPLLQRAAREVTLTTGAVRVADFGCAQGKNSLAPMHSAIAALRLRTREPVEVVHTDIPSNDFGALFELLASPESYLRGTADVYAYAAGISFYERIFAAQSQTLGWNSIAVHWLSSPPCNIPNHIWSPYAQGDVRAAWRARATQDWQHFLDARSAEYVSGGQIVVVASSADDKGYAGAEGLMNMANDELLAMVRRRVISGDTYDRMAIPTYYRTRAEFEAPFQAANASFALVESEPTILQDPFWPAYEQNHDAQAFAQAYTAFFRAFSEPCLFGETNTPQASEFYDGVCKRIAADPAAAVCRWQLLLMRIKRK